MEKKLETLIAEYKDAKEAAKAEMQAKLAPLWAEVLKVQAEVKAVKVAEKKAKRIAYLKEELAKLEA